VRRFFPPIPTESGRPGRLTIREARLRREAAERYPGLPVGVWLPASQVGAECLARTAAERCFASPTARALGDDAFEFRGGTPEIALRRRARTRWTDYPGPVTASRRAVRDF
jgi:hypothetical protein